MALLVSACLYLFYDYIKIKARDKANEATIKSLLNNRKLVEKLTIEVNRDQAKNYEMQKKFLIEMDNKGYIDTPDGKSPEWMRYKPSHSPHKQSTR